MSARGRWVHRRLRDLGIVGEKEGACVIISEADVVSVWPKRRITLLAVNRLMNGQFGRDTISLILILALEPWGAPEKSSRT